MTNQHEYYGKFTLRWHLAGCPAGLRVDGRAAPVPARLLTAGAFHYDGEASTALVTYMPRYRQRIAAFPHKATISRVALWADTGPATHSSPGLR